MMICLLPALPLLFALVLAVWRLRRAWLRNAYAVLSSLLVAGATVFVLLKDPGEPAVLLEVLPGLSFTLRLDEMGRLFAGLISALWPLSTLYATEYLRHEERANTFFVWFLTAYAATLLVVCAGNLFTLYIGYEWLTFSTLPLVWHKQDEASLLAAHRYARYTLGAGVLGLLAVCAVYIWTGSTDFTPGVLFVHATVESGLIRLCFLIAFFGFGVKAAVLPLSAWLPAASAAPTPVTALLHAVAVVNTGAFSLFRCIYQVFGVSALRGTYAQTVSLLAACVTILFASAAALKEHHLKRRLAWSTVSNLSYMLMGACLMTDAGLVGALTHFLFHSVIKITLFFCAGAFLVQSERETVEETRGLGRVMPVTCACFTVASCALVGVPPLNGFLSKWNLLTAAAALQSGFGATAIATLLLSALLTAAYLFPVAYGFYFRPLNTDLMVWGVQRHDPTWRMILPICLLAAAMLALGLLGQSVTDWLWRIVSISF